MVCKKPYVVLIPGLRKTERLLESTKAADVELTTEEVMVIEDRVDNMEMSGVFGGYQWNNYKENVYYTDDSDLTRS